MRKHGYDIAIDLMGLTFGARPGIWAQGIAPIQISYLGCPGTTGAPYMDYILADDIVIPQTSRRTTARKYSTYPTASPKPTTGNAPWPVTPRRVPN